jgi:glycosyltransferase involved in cell wall biosynthesis
VDEFSTVLAGRWSAEPPDVVHAHFWMSGLASVAAARPLGIPVALTFHALGSVKRRHQGNADPSAPARVALERRLAGEVDLLLATSTSEIAELERNGARLRRSVVVPCGVNLAQFRATGPSEPRPADRHRVVVVSRLVERKGIADVLTAVADLPDVDLVIAGGPPAGVLDDDPEARRLLLLADELGIADRVELRGAVTRAEVPGLLRSADVVACCPWYEPFGLVAVEAMACGVPVLASDVGGLAETVVHGLTGLRVRPRDPAHIAAALRQLLDDPGCRRAMGQAGVRRAARYGWHAVAAQTYGHLAALVRRTGPRHLAGAVGSGALSLRPVGPPASTPASAPEPVAGPLVWASPEGPA